MIYLVIGIMFALLFIGEPIFIVFALFGSIIGIWHLGIPLAALAEITYSGMNVWVLVAVPFFILAGNLMSYSGCAASLFDFVESLVGHVPGGLAVAVVIACAIFGAMSGSSIAVASAVGTISISSLIKAGYPDGFSAGLIAVSGTLGQMIPPSIYFIILGAVLDLSVGELFLAGILPGILLTLLLSITASGISYRKNYAIKPAANWVTRGKKFLKAIPALVSPVIVIGGIYGGIFTPTEAAAISCLYSLLVGLFYYRGLNRETIRKTLSNTVTTTSMVYLLVGTAVLMNVFFTYTKIPQAITNYVAVQQLSATAFLMLACLLLLIFGFFLDALPIIYICAPLLFPTAIKLGISPIVFSVLFCLTLMIGQITPPVGLCLYATSSFSGVSADKVIKGSIPFLLAMIAGLLVILLWPNLSLYLPGLLH